MVFTTFLKLATMALVPVLASIVFILLDKRTAFGELAFVKKQLIIGFTFGIITICGTEFGVDAGGAILNVRDASVLSAGLLFGGPAGIMAGLMGGIHRFLAVYWGAGVYTRVGCTIATTLAGFVAASLRRFMFEYKRPGVYYAFGIGLIMEVFHILMIFVTHLDDVRTAFDFVVLCGAPMISVNAISVTLSTLFVNKLAAPVKTSESKELRKLSRTFSQFLLVLVAIAFFVSVSFSTHLQTRLSESDALEMLRLNISDVKDEINRASDEALLRITRQVAKDLEDEVTIESDYLKQLAMRYSVEEINFIGMGGAIMASTNPDFIGFNMRSGEQAREFIVLLDPDVSEYVQSYGPVTYDPSIYRKYAGVSVGYRGFVQVGYNAAHFQSELRTQLGGVTRHRRVGETGSIIIANTTGKIISDRFGHEGESLNEIGIDYPINKPHGELFKSAVYENDSYCCYEDAEGYYIIASMPESEVMLDRNVSAYVMVFMLLIVFGILFCHVFFLIKSLIVDNIRKVNESLSKITGGDLNVLVDVRASEEFSSLSDDINSTVETLKRYIAKEAARIDKDLEFAKTIQSSALPSVFPPFPNHKEFDIYAHMETAKEVGGDFYDFYFVGEDKLAILIADVSGKGIPAAMFMMQSKALIKGLAEAGHSVKETLEMANDQLCEHNDANMFVTVWLGFLDVNTGRLTYASAGHNPPLLRKRSGEVAYLTDKPGFVLAGMEGMVYRENELAFDKGDMLFLYTDGVTEATNSSEELYGEERLLNFLKEHGDSGTEAVCKGVTGDALSFTGDAPQFDDITVLALEYKGF